MQLLQCTTPGTPAADLRVQRAASAGDGSCWLHIATAVPSGIRHGQTAYSRLHPPSLLLLLLLGMSHAASPEC